MLYEGVQVMSKTLIIEYLHFESRLECLLLACKVRSREVRCEDVVIRNA